MTQEEKRNEQSDDVTSSKSRAFSYQEDGTLEELAPDVYDSPQDMENAPEHVWSVQKIWNESFDAQKREPKERDYVSMSDIGKTDLWSRYMKMKGYEETNPFPDRVERVLQAGDEFHELVKTVMKKAGLFINSQDELDENGEVQRSRVEGSKDTLPQIGHYDLLVGGVPQVESALRWIAESDLSPFAKDRAYRIARFFAEKFPNGLRPLLYEVKSINSNAFWGKKNYLYDAYPHHMCQAFGYLRANYRNAETDKLIERAGLPGYSVEEARLLYISKDDLTMAEFPVMLGNRKLSERYDKDVTAISYYYMNDIEPPKPPYIVFNPRKMLTFQKDKKKYQVRGSFEVNWEVVRSPYFTMMTGFDSTDKFEYWLKDDLSKKNAEVKTKVLERIGKL